MDWNLIDGFISAAAALITAAATFFLWRVTHILAIETRRMADSSAQPHIVATVLPNPRSMIHFDLHVDNTGNATAYDIQVNFDPPLDHKYSGQDPEKVPLQKISVLKAGQGLHSYLCDYKRLERKIYKVTTSWRLNAQATTREENIYTLDMSDLDGMSRLGSDPVIEIANHIKKLEEHLGHLTTGFKRIKADIYTSSDRVHEQRAEERHYRQIRRNKGDT